MMKIIPYKKLNVYHLKHLYFIKRKKKKNFKVKNIPIFTIMLYMITIFYLTSYVIKQYYQIDLFQIIINEMFPILKLLLDNDNPYSDHSSSSGFIQEIRKVL